MRRLRSLWSLALGLVLSAVLAAPAFAQLKEVPPLSARVTDQAGMLEPAQRERLEAVLADYEARTGSQIAVLLVQSTEPEAIEQYGIRVTDAWKLGRKGVDDGVLLLVARDNPSALRRLRIEAGRGVQGVLTDAQSKRILQDVIAPHFRQNHYYEGLVAGVGAIATLLDKESFPAPQQQGQARTAPSGDGGGFSLFAIVPLIIGFMLLRSMFRPRRVRMAPGWGHSGLGSATTGFILGNIIGNMSRGGGGFGGGGGGGGFGGGFSGGGGSFDGGGASGDW